MGKDFYEGERGNWSSTYPIAISVTPAVSFIMTTRLLTMLHLSYVPPIPPHQSHPEYDQPRPLSSERLVPAEKRKIGKTGSTRMFKIIDGRWFVGSNRLMTALAKDTQI
jgi:hypothetical protein